MSKLFRFDQLMTIALIGVVIIGTAADIVFADDDYGLDLYSTKELFEENAFQAAFDMWINQSDTVSAAMKNSPTAEESPGWRLKHVLFVPKGTEHLYKWIVPEYKRTLVISGGLESGLLIAQDENDPGYYGFSERNVDDQYNYDTDKLLSDDVCTVITVNSDYIDDTSEPSASNLTNVGDGGDNLWGCVKYEAGESKSLEDYARESSSADSETFYNIVNSTGLGFSFEQHDALSDVLWHFDTPTASLLLTYDQDTGEYVYKAGVLKRVRVWLHKKKFKRKTMDTKGGTLSTTKSIFQPISNAQAQLQAIPNGAKYFFKKDIGSGFWKKKTGVGAVMNGIKKAVFGYIAVLGIVGLVAIALVIIYRKQITSVAKKAIDKL